MMQLSATHKMKASSLEKEARGCFVAFLAGSKTSILWEILEYLFDKCPEAKEEEGPPSKKIHLEDEPSTISDPSDPKLPTAPSSKIKIAFPLNESSLHDSDINQEYLPFHKQLPHRKGVYLCGFQCRYCAQSRATDYIHPHKEHLNIMLGCLILNIMCGLLMHGLSMFAPMILSSLN